MWFPYFSDRSLKASGSSTIRRVIIVVHGTDRDSRRYWRAVTRAARLAGEGLVVETVVIAPQFTTRSDVEKLGLRQDTIVWRNQDWKIGGDSRCHNRASSFEVVDALIANIEKSQSYPNLESIVIVGHSAGGQFVQRYAALNVMDDGYKNYRTRYVVVNPSSYMYLDEKRPSILNERVMVIPRLANKKDQTDYNNYKYGLENPVRYFDQLALSEIRSQYQNREVVYLVGEDDDDMSDPTMDQSPAALLQGLTRLTRGYAYQSHLLDVFGEAKASKHVLEIIPGLGHEGPRIIRSQAGRRWLFW